MRDERTIVVLEGDETGQELLEESLRVLEPDVIGVELEFPRFDLSLDRRRETDNGIVHEAAAAIREHGLGLKAATITPEGRGDVGSPNRIIREEIGGRVIVRTGRRIPGVTPVGGVHAPISIVRMAVGDAYGAKEWRDSRNAPAGAHDDPAADLLADDAVRRADVAASLGGDGGCLQAETVRADRRRRLVDDPVVGLAAPLEREIEARELELDPDHVRSKHAEALLQQLLAGLVALEDDDRLLVAHRRAV